MNDLQIFNYNGKEIRTVEKNGDLWWVLKDVCEVLELSNPTMIAGRLDEDEKDIFKTKSDLALDIPNRGVSIINESGPYNVILRSDKPEAKKFKRWVTHKVLPPIRRHGAYMTDKALEEALTSPDFLIKLATQLKDERDKRIAVEAKSQAQEQIIKELKPKADYTDRILKNSGLVTITQIAKDYGMSGQGMNALLNRLCVQYKTASGQWLLYSKYQAKGYTHSKTIDIIRTDGTTDIKMETKWTQKGRLFLYEKLKKHGYLPMIEKEG